MNEKRVNEKDGSQSVCPTCSASKWWLQDRDTRSYWDCLDAWHREAYVPTPTQSLGLGEGGGGRDASNVVAAGALDAINELHDDVERVAAERDQALAEVERLRDLAKALCGERDVDAAFEALEAMTAEVERLRTALEEIVGLYDDSTGTVYGVSTVNMAHRVARRALTGNTIPEHFCGPACKAADHAGVVRGKNAAEVERLEADIDIIERALDETNYPPGTQLWIDGHAAVARLAQALGIERVTT